MASSSIPTLLRLRVTYLPPPTRCHHFHSALRSPHAGAARFLPDKKITPASNVAIATLRRFVPQTWRAACRIHALGFVWSRSRAASFDRTRRAERKRTSKIPEGRRFADERGIGSGSLCVVPSKHTIQSKRQKSETFSRFLRSQKGKRVVLSSVASMMRCGPTTKKKLPKLHERAARAETLGHVCP